MLLSLAIVYSGICGGIIFGWPALILIFRADGVYGEACEAFDPENANQQGSTVSACQEQEIQLGVIFVCGFAAQMISHFIMGSVLDKFGPRTANASGLVMIVAGCLLLAYSLSQGISLIHRIFIFSPSFSDVNGYLLGFGLIGFGGPAAHMSGLHLGNLWPTRKGTIMTLLNGAFGPSAYVFLAFLVRSFPTPPHNHPN